MKEINDKIQNSFNSIKNIVYNNKLNEKYSFEEMVDVLIADDFTEEELIKLKELYKCVDDIKIVVEDLGTKLLDINDIDFSKKYIIESEVKEIILLIDIFIDSLNKITQIIEFKENRINVIKSVARLKSLRANIIKKVINTKVSLQKTNPKVVKMIILDIIDSLIKESYKLRIIKMHQLITKKISDLEY